MTIKLLPVLAILARVMIPDLAAATAPSADVVVYGGVPCGIAAAIAAAREGAKVVLIEA